MNTVVYTVMNIGVNVNGAPQPPKLPVPRDPPLPLDRVGERRSGPVQRHSFIPPGRGSADLTGKAEPCPISFAPNVALLEWDKSYVDA